MAYFCILYRLSKPYINKNNRLVRLTANNRPMAELTHTYSVGDVDNEQSHIVKIVHISDTHWMHEKLVVPDGDVLVHSGDFVKSSPERLLARQSDEQFDDDLLQIKEYFASLPHRYKIFIAGNHELSFTSRDRTW